MRRVRELVYLASPYTHDDLGVRHARERKATLAAGKLVEMGFSVVAPITQSHRIAELTPGIGALAHDTWMEVDIAILKRVDRLIVLEIEGWDVSKGVQEEVSCAQEHGIPVSFMNERGELDV